MLIGVGTLFRGMSIAAVAWLVIAGVVAGVIGTAGGITSLVSYPALLAAGVAPLPANVANLVAVVACWPGAAVTSRRELTGLGRSLRGLAAASAVGAVTGSVLLLSTPPGVFIRVVPFLVLAGSVALLLQPAVTAHRGGPPAGHPAAVLGGVGAVSVYGGYFGAGSGVMLLALLLLLREARLPVANAVKNMLVGAAATASAAVFTVAGPVPWAAVAPLAVGLFAGSTVGPLVVRRLPSRVLRWAAAALGVVLSVLLWLNPSG
jgi:uncharacterized membrane protein YfcA